MITTSERCLTVDDLIDPTEAVIPPFGEDPGVDFRASVGDAVNQELLDLTKLGGNARISLGRLGEFDVDMVRLAVSRRAGHLVALIRQEASGYPVQSRTVTISAILTGIAAVRHGRTKK